MNDRFSTWLRSMSNVRLGAVLLFASFAVNAPLVFFAELPPISGADAGPNEMMQSMSIGTRLFYGSIVVPLFETALFQLGPVLLLRRLLRVRWALVILASATLFAAGHMYSGQYMAFAFLVGLVFAYGFSIRDDQVDRAFVLVAVVHGLRNAVVSLIF